MTDRQTKASRGKVVNIFNPKQLDSVSRINRIRQAVSLTIEQY